MNRFILKRVTLLCTLILLFYTSFSQDNHTLTWSKGGLATNKGTDGMQYSGISVSLKVEDVYEGANFYGVNGGFKVEKAKPIGYTYKGRFYSEAEINKIYREQGKNENYYFKSYNPYPKLIVEVTPWPDEFGKGVTSGIFGEKQLVLNGLNEMFNVKKLTPNVIGFEYETNIELERLLDQSQSGANSEQQSSNTNQQSSQIPGRVQNKSVAPQTALERENALKAQHEAHVKANNERYTAQQQYNQQTTYTQKQEVTVSPELQRKHEEWKKQQEAELAQIQKQQREQEAKMQRVEFYNNQSLNILSNHLANSRPLRVNINSVQSSQTPQQVLSNLKSIETQVKSQIQQNNTNLTLTLSQYSNMSSGTVEQAQANMVGAGAAAISTIAANQEAKKQLEQAQEAAKRQMDKFYEEQLDFYKNVRNKTLSAAIYAFEEQTETQALESYFYYTCLENYTRLNKSYTSTRWAEADRYSECEKPQTSNVSSWQKTSDTHLKVAKRKFKLYTEYSNTDFLEVAKYHVNEAIRLNKNNAEAYIFSAQLSGDDIILTMQNLLIAKGIQKSSFKHDEWLRRTEERFDAEFYKAIFSNNISFITQALNLGFYPQSKYANAMSPIQVSIAADNVSIFNQLTTYSKTESKYSKTYFVNAFSNNKIQITNYFFGKNMWATLTPKEQKAALISAFQNNAVETLSLVPEELEKLNSFVKYDDEKSKKLSEMYVAIALHTNNAEYVSKALETSNLTDLDLITLLERIDESVSKEVLGKIVTQFTSPYVRNQKGESLFQIAIRKNSSSLLDVLFERGFKEGTDGENSAVDYLLLYNSSLVVSNLSKYNFDYTRVDSDGVPALHKVVYKKPEYLTAILQTSNIGINNTGLYGWTALHYAAREGNVKAVKALIRAGADKSIEDKWGRTAKKIAQEYGNKKVKHAIKYTRSNLAVSSQETTVPSSINNTDNQK